MGDLDALVVDGVRYRILDPTGNITALVESDVVVDAQPDVARRIMQRHPAVEQVGFVSHEDAGSGDGRPSVRMRMAGGEFCGNATMSAAALLLWRMGGEWDVADPDAWTNVLVRVWGVREPVEVRLQPCEDGSFRGGVRMPPAEGVELPELTFGSLTGQIPLVRMVGISHVVIEASSVFAGLRGDRAAAERAVRAWCAELATDGLGLMFLSQGEEGYELTPLVYVPGGDTVFWENSCASGTSAVGIYLARKTGTAVDMTLQEPGGSLRVTSDPASGETWLYGSVRMAQV
ncbi:MAG: hypothetical protein J6D34_11480 [Atopobiaceae bacterium]|nr:hypothetical protein [Atopobiaceae bacterium]